LGREPSLGRVSRPPPNWRAELATALRRCLDDKSRPRENPIADTLAIGRWARSRDAAFDDLVAGLIGENKLPKHSVDALRAALPSRPRRAALLALRLLAAGADGIVAELASMSPRRAERAVAYVRANFGRHIVDRIVEGLADMPGPHLRRGGMGIRLDELIHRAATGGQIARLIAHASAFSPRLCEILAGKLAALEPDDDGFVAFLEAVAPLRRRWTRLPVELREAALAAWGPAVAARPGLRRRAADLLPDLVLEAARWAEDRDALVELIDGPDPGRAFALLLRLDEATRQRLWARLRRRIGRLDRLPEPWLAAARQRPKIFEFLIRNEPLRLARGSLEGLALAPLMEASLRHRSLARRLAETHDAATLTAAMPALRRRLSGHTRRGAAAELALLLGWELAVGLAFLATRPYAHADRPGTRFDGLYRSWFLPKRKGGKRQITAPAPLLKLVQRRLLDRVFAAAPCHPAATGFRPGISIADNARPHVGRKVVVNVDIQGFFPNTGFKRLRRAVERALPPDLSPEARRLVVDICAMDGGLPTGAPTSPAIANLVMGPVDRALARVAARHGVAYTRYADDLTLSGDDPLPLLPFLRQAIGRLGYQLDPKKTNIFRRGRRQIVTGLVVNDKVSVPRRLRRRLRAAAHRVARDGAAAALTWNRRPMNAGELAGHIAFIGVAHPEESRALAAALAAGRQRP
jgi:retron-type reverse transcriptase